MEKLLTPQEIAELLGIQMSTLYCWTHQGFIPYVKVGRLLRFKESEILKWLEKKSIPGRSTRKIDINQFLK